MEEQAGVGRLIQLMQGGESSARQSHNRPGCRACEKKQVFLQDPPSLHPFPTFPCPLLGHYRLKVCSKYLKSVVRVDTAPAALL